MERNFHVYLPLVMRETEVVRHSSSRTAQSCSHLHWKSFQCIKLDRHNCTSGYWQICTEAFGRTITEVKGKLRFNYSRPAQTAEEEMAEKRCFSCHHYLSHFHLEPLMTGTARGQRYCRSVPWHSVWMQQMPFRLEGHMLPGLLCDSRQLVIKFNTSLFSPQLCVQGPSFKLFFVTFYLIYTQLQLCYSLFGGSGREKAHADSWYLLVLQRPSGGSLSAGVMEVRDFHTWFVCSQQDELLRHYRLF